MWRRIGIAVVCLGAPLFLASCSDGQLDMSFDEFKSELEKWMREPTGAMVTEKCRNCDSSGKVIKESKSREVCPECSGKGKRLGDCSICKGTGKGFTKGKPCQYCGGTGERIQVCPKCNSSGHLVKTLTKRMDCPDCKGAGKVQVKEYKKMTQARFIDKFGEPSKKQYIDGDTYWYYECNDGLIQISMHIRPDTDRIYPHDPSLY